MMMLYGISHCDTVRKARRWLQSHQIEAGFHDYRKNGLTETQLRDWCAALGWEALVNKRGTTWRKLPDQLKAAMNSETAITVMLEQPAIIKRPLLDVRGQLVLGFNEELYTSTLLKG